MMLFRAIYVSRHDLPVKDDGSCPVFDEITSDAERRNRADGVTMFLICTPHWFCQVLEGPEDAVRRALGRIARDSRHCEMRLIQAAPVRESSGLGGAAMVYKRLANRLIFLERGFSRAIVPFDRSPDELVGLCGALRRHGAAQEEELALVG